jgi:aryl-alcohol dehydrogenase-like predicted oxidoreductase
MRKTLRAYDKLLQAGKVRAIGASNYDADQLSAAMKAAQAKNLPAYQVLQPEYNLYDRDAYDGALRDLCINEELGVVTYYSLASGFLSGKYRSEADLGKSQRGKGVAKYLDKRGLAILKALDAVAARHQAKPAEIALAWLMAREGVTAPIASATSVAQVESFARAANLTLTSEDAFELDSASVSLREGQRGVASVRKLTLSSLVSKPAKPKWN